MMFWNFLSGISFCFGLDCRYHHRGIIQLCAVMLSFHRHKLSELVTPRKANLGGELRVVGNSELVETDLE